MSNTDIVQALKAAAAQLSNAAYYIEHQHEPDIAAALSSEGKTIVDWVEPLIWLADRRLEDVPRTKAELTTYLNGE